MKDSPILTEIDFFFFWGYVIGNITNNDCIIGLVKFNTIIF